jgi:hypothetical protein
MVMANREIPANTLVMDKPFIVTYSNVVNTSDPAASGANLWVRYRRN